MSEQLLYEVGDPAAYLTPDVTADFTSVTLAEQGPDRVRLTGSARPAGPGCLQGLDRLPRRLHGQRHAGDRGPGCRGQGPALRRDPAASGCDRVGIEPSAATSNAWAAGDSVPGVLPRPVDVPEVVLRVAVHDSRRPVVERFTKEFAPLVTSGPPGVTGYTTGRPAVREVFAYWPALVPRELVTAEVRMVP